MKCPTLWHLQFLLWHAANNMREFKVNEETSVFVPARPLGYPSLWHRFKCAWLVFTGRADVVTWPYGQ